LSESKYEEAFKEKFKIAWKAEEFKLKRLGKLKSDQDLLQACKRFASRWDFKWKSNFSQYVVTEYEKKTMVQAFNIKGSVL